MVANVSSFSDCVSSLEKKHRLGVYLVSGLILIAMLIAWPILLVALIGWLVSLITAECQVRKIQALGVTVSERQLPTVYQAYLDVCRRFGVTGGCRVVVINQSASNALALRIARKHVVVLFSQMLEGVIDNPAQLRSLLAHELCHLELSSGWRRMFQLYQPAQFRQGRELTCDNAGYAACESAEDTKNLLRKLCVGNTLFPLLSEQALVTEAQQIEAGITGWFVRRHLSHPPVGTRLTNIDAFAAAHPRMVTAARAVVAV